MSQTKRTPETHFSTVLTVLGKMFARMGSENQVNLICALSLLRVNNAVIPEE